MNEKQRILEMVEQGKITAKEALELLEALEEPEIKSSVIVTGKKYKTLKVIVYAEKDDVNVNVNIPLSLVRVMGGMVKDFSHMIPDEARKHMHEQGVDISMIDVEGILQALETGTLENPELVNIDVNNEKDGIVKVKVYLDEN